MTLSPRLRGIALMCAALFMFSCLDTLGKHMGQELPPLQITAFRYFMAFLFIFLISNPLKFTHHFKTKRIGLQFTRSLILLGSTLLNFIALRYLQLDQTMAIIFTTPFFVALLAGPILNEWIGKYRLFAVIVGFIGVLIITQPWKGNLHPAMFLTLGGAICYAFYSITTRILSKVDSTDTTALHSNLWPALIMLPVLFFVWKTPSSLQIWLELFAIGLFGGFGHLLLIKAYVLAPAPVLSPFVYTQMIWMIGFGFLVFDDVPAANTLAGVAIVVLSGLYLLYRETIRPIQK
jgi:drug/metabolite transporter (DMT)-like permease